MKQAQRRITAAVALILVGGLLSACSNDKGGDSSSSDSPVSGSSSDPASEGTQGAPSQGAEAPGEPAAGVTLSFWNPFTGSDGDILREIVDRYNSTNTLGTTVQIDIMPNAQLLQKLPASISTNTAPDFVLFGIENLAPYVATDSLEDISDFWDTTGTDISNFSETVVNHSILNGVLYGVPMQYNTTSYLYWNKDLFTAAGLDPEKPPTTLDELTEMAQALTDPSQNRFGIGLASGVAYPQFLWANGGDIDDPATNTNLLDSPENLATLEWLYDLAVNKKVTPQLTAPEGDIMLQNGQIAMYMSGPWQINGLRQQGVNFGVTAPPAGSAGVFSTAGGCSFVIPKGSDATKRTAVYDFMTYWLSDEILKEWSMRNGFPVWSKSLMEDPEIVADEVLTSISKATETARSYNLGYPLAAQIDNDAVIPMFDAILTGASSASDALAAASAKMDEILAQ